MISMGLIQADKLRVIFILIFLFVSLPAVAAKEYPGFPPDCWNENRNVHNLNEWNLLKKNLKFSHVLVEPAGKKIYSPNKGYYFVADGFRPKSQVTIYSENNLYWKLSFTNIFYLANPKWVNEKILFLRVYWGKIAFEDVLIDVEKESILSSESGTDATIAYQQFQSGCKTMGGCQCIQKEAPQSQPLKETPKNGAS